MRKVCKIRYGVKIPPFCFNSIIHPMKVMGDARLKKENVSLHNALSTFETHWLKMWPLTQDGFKNMLDTFMEWLF